MRRINVYQYIILILILFNYTTQTNCTVIVASLTINVVFVYIEKTLSIKECAEHCAKNKHLCGHLVLLLKLN